MKPESLQSLRRRRPRLAGLVQQHPVGEGRERCRKEAKEWKSLSSFQFTTQGLSLSSSITPLTPSLEAEPQPPPDRTVLAQRGIRGSAAVTDAPAARNQPQPDHPAH